MRPRQLLYPRYAAAVFGNWKAKDWMQAELADELDSNVKKIDNCERRAVNPALGVVQACTKALDVSTSYLVGAHDELHLKQKKTGPSRRW